MSQTQLQGQTGALPPHEYGPPDNRQFDRSRRGRRPVWPWVTAAVALVVIGALVYAYRTINGHGSGVAVPANLIGMTYQNADNAIVGAGLTFKNVSVAPPPNGTAYTPNDVKSTSPSPGTQVSRGTQVTVFYYRSPGSKPIPSVAGLSVKAATALLHAHGFFNITPGNSVPSTIKPGNVVKTDPPAGFVASPNQAITLILSAGGVAMPNVVGMPLGQAEKTLAAHQLFYTVMKHADPNGTTRPGYVWNTSPLYPKVVAPGSSVTLYVQPGPSPSPTPTTSTSSPSPTGSPSTSPPPVPAP